MKYNSFNKGRVNQRKRNKKTRERQKKGQQQHEQIGFTMTLPNDMTRFSLRSISLFTTKQQNDSGATTKHYHMHYRCHFF
mmetsp:Transcript_28396/g.59324  ORF Transcript_28396/g.59324 Transcript_28396/m.59324 type:complete len:80 (-) Transcript_28396:85-324(-)